SCLKSRLNAGLQHVLQSVGPDTLSPSRHRAGIDWQLVLEEFEAAKILPVDILDPARNQLLVGKVVDMLQIMQPDHQPRRFRGATNRSVETAKRLIEPRPVDNPGKL